MSIVNVSGISEIAEIEFSDIVLSTTSKMNYLKIYISDGSFIDIWYSLKIEGRYSYHWERKLIDGTIYRHNNAPHKKWMDITSFPKHFHNGKEENTEESKISDEPKKALREFLEFVRKSLKK